MAIVGMWAWVVVAVVAGLWQEVQVGLATVALCWSAAAVVFAVSESAKSRLLFLILFFSPAPVIAAMIVMAIANHAR
ncbi:MAG: hypothetical protein HYV77_01090 [Candidatus Wildermuthbacteria bacterium]|nr:hypothetical protein [Candidatus Wildermuthbacteria bacterium]